MADPSELTQQLIDAIENENKQEIDDALAAGADINASHSLSGMLPINKAVLANNADILEYLIEKKADVHAVGEDGTTALSVAASVGETACLDALLNAGAKLDSRDGDSYTPLMNAALGAHKAFVEALVNKSAPVDAVDQNGLTALMHACSVGARDVVEVLLKASADCNIKDKKGETALTIAVSSSARSCEAAINVHLEEQKEIERKKQIVLEEYEKSLNAETVKRLIRTLPFQNWTHADCILLFKSTEALSAEFVKLSIDNAKITGELLSSEFAHNFFKDEMGCKPSDGFAANKAVQEVIEYQAERKRIEGKANSCCTIA